MLEKLINIGVEQISDPSEKNKVRLINVCLLLSLSIITIFTVFFKVTGPEDFAALITTLIVLMILLMSGFYFNKIGSHYIANHILLIGGFLVISIAEEIYLGNGPEIHYFFILYVVGAILGWGLKRPIEIAFYFLLFLSSNIYFEYFHTPNLRLQHYPDYLIRSMGIATIIFTYLIIAIVIMLFESYRSRREIQLNEKNKSLIDAIDVLEIKSLEIENQKKSLEEMNNIKDKFFSIIAHDLINPVGSNKKALEILSDNYRQLSEDEKLLIIKELKESSQKVYTLLENLLEWSRSQSGKISFTPENYHVRPLVDSQFSLCKLQAEAKSLYLQNKVPYSTIGYFDINMMTTILRNLISNAVKFTPDSGTITVNASLADNFLTVSVEDTGIGIDASKQELLFKLSTYTISSGTTNEKGTGLGLILCKEFVEKHNGEIRIESEPGKGSKFIFSLPLEKASHSSV